MCVQLRVDAVGIELLQRYGNENQHLSAGEGFFHLDEAGADFLLEDYQAPMDSAAQCCLCKCGHKTLEASNPQKFRSYHGYLPEIEEEESMPFSYSQRQNEISPPSDDEFRYISYTQSIRDRGRSTRDKKEASVPFSYNLHRNEISPPSDEETSYVGYPQSVRDRGRSTREMDVASMQYPYSQRRNEISPPSDEEVSYIAYPQSIRGRGRSALDNDLEFAFSDPSSLGRRSSVGTPFLPTDERVTGISESFQCIDLEKEHMMVSPPSHFIVQTRPRDGRKMVLYTSGKLRRSSQENLDIYDSRASFLDPVSGSRNLRHQGPQSPGFDVQYFRNNHGVLVPTIVQPKQAMSNSASDLPSSSSVSVSSDEAEHPQIKVGLYKTELCRSWEEAGYCRYAAKCQFAHGNEDLRSVPRHPKYKTELCRSYTETGLCSYGKRCRFIHSSSGLSQAFPSSSNLEKNGSRRLSIFQKLCTGAGENMPPRQA